MGDLINSFQYGTPAAIIVALYLLISEIIKNKRDKKQAIINQHLVDSFTNLNKFLDYFTKDIIEKEQEKCEYAIKDCFKSFASQLVNFSINTIINNNVNNNRETIIENIQHLVSTEYWNIYGCLLLFKAGNEKVSDYLDNKWIDEVTEDIINIIFDTSKTKEERIYNIINKVKIECDKYCIHVLNRYSKQIK